MIGAGLQFNFETSIDPISSKFDGDSDLYVSYSGINAFSKYVGGSVTPDCKRMSFNLGIGVGLPVLNFSGSLESTTKYVAAKLKSGVGYISPYLKSGAGYISSALKK